MSKKKLRARLANAKDLLTQQADELETAYGLIEKLQLDLLQINHEALRDAYADEAVRTAENIGRIAGNRMDALEQFYNDLLAGRYDSPGTLPTPVCEIVHESPEEEACEKFHYGRGS